MKTKMMFLTNELHSEYLFNSFNESAPSYWYAFHKFLDLFPFKQKNQLHSSSNYSSNSSNSVSKSPFLPPFFLLFLLLLFLLFFFLLFFLFFFFLFLLGAGFV